MPLRILHVIQTLTTGGAGRAALTMARRSRDLAGHEHRMLSLLPCAREAVELAFRHGVETVSSPDGRSLLDELGKADIVLVHWWNTPEIADFLQYPVPEVRTVFWLHVGGHVAPQIIVPELLERADHVAACSPFTMESPPLADLPALHGADRASMLFASGELEPFFELEPSGHEGFVVTYAGTVDPVKMHPDFVQLCAAVRVPDIRFVVCGGGGQELVRQQAARAGILDRMEILGPVADVATHFRRADVFGYPLCRETYAASELVLQEAMAAGLPCVVFPHGGISKLVLDGKTGLVANNATEYRDAIERLRNDPALRRALGSAAREHARAEFHPERWARAWNARFERMAQGPKTAHPEGLVPRRGRSWGLLFADSLGSAGADFKTSFVAGTSASAADARIARSSVLVASASSGGIFQYRNAHPEDPHLRLWSALVLEEKGMMAEAASELSGAIEAGLADARTLRHTARVSTALGSPEIARKCLEKAARLEPDPEVPTGSLEPTGRGGITAIVYGRNDSHGQNLPKRATISLNCLAEQLDPGRDEILFVDCNSADDVPTFPESIGDLLTARARSLLRILRLRSDPYRGLARGSEAPVLEALCRNIALRRADRSRSWVLSTNTDVAVHPLSGPRLTDLVASLPPRLHGAPRFDIPQGLWETLDRTDPASCLDRMKGWMDRFGLRNGSRVPHDFILWDNPGDFQLFPLESLRSLGGFDESMVDGPYHIDSNMARRLCLRLGPALSLDGRLEVYHCDHSRQSMARQSTPATRGNDWTARVMGVEDPDLSPAQPNWGAAGEDVEEILLDRPGRDLATALEPLVDRDPEPFLLEHGTDREWGTHVPLGRLLPFLLDHLLQIPRGRRIGVLSPATDLSEALEKASTTLGLSARIVPLRPGVRGTNAQLAEDWDIFIVDPGTRGPRFPVEAFAGCVCEFARHQSARALGGRAKVVLLMPHQSWLGFLGRHLFDLHQAPTATWIFHGRTVDASRLPPGLPELPCEEPDTAASERPGSDPATPAKAEARIGFDGRVFSVPDSVVRGIGHYAFHHLEALLKTRPGCRIEVLHDDQQPPPDEIRQALEALGARFTPWSSRTSVDFDLFHTPDPMYVAMGFPSPFQRFGSTRCTATFHDLIPLRLYEGRVNNWSSYLARLDEIRDLGVRLLCNSDFTRMDLLEATDIPASRAATVGAGWNTTSTLRKDSEPDPTRSLLARLGITKPFFLHVGACDPHKNFDNVLFAAQTISRRRPLQLVVVGKLASSIAGLRDAVVEHGIADVVFTDFLSREELDLLYARAVATVFLSRYEGFGFPALEAMANGCPLIASDATSLPEVVGDAGLLHSPDDVAGVAASMERLLDDPSLRQKLSQKGLERSRAFRWEVVAERTWRIWDEIRREPRPAPEVPPSPAKVQWISPIWDPSGYADESRAFARHLASTDLGVRIFHAGRHSETFRRAASAADRALFDGAMGREAVPGPIAVLDMPASILGRFPGCGHHVGRTTFETDGLPSDWVVRCDMMDEIWVPCAFNKATFAKAGVTKPILVVPEGVDTDKFRPGLEPLDLPGPRRATTYLAVFEWTHRKAPDLLLQAWATAFSADDDVRLVLRTYPPNQIEGDPATWVEAKIDEELARIGKRRSDCAPIAVIAKQVPDADMPRLYAAADVYLAPSRGEGWGRPHMEAMSCGVPVIATRWSGNLDFQTDDNSWLIEIDGLEEIDAREEFPFYRGQKWAKPSLTRFVLLLRESRGDAPLRRAKGERARKDMLEKWDWSRIAPLAETRLREILAGIPSDRSELAHPKALRKSTTDSVTSPPALRWAGPVFNYSGYARLARETLKGLMDAGVPVSCDPQLNDKEFFSALSGKDTEIARWKTLLGTQPTKGPLVICDIPRDTKGGDILATLSRDNSACDKRICWTMFETDRLPDGWASALNTMDEIWVPSNFNRATFARAGVQESKLHVIPGCIDAAPYANAAPMPLPGSGYTFLSVFQWIERKGWDVLLDAWSRAFKATDPVRLVLRSHPFGKAEPVSRQLERFLSNRGLRRQDLAPVHLIEEFLPDDALPGLFAACDCFALPTRGEGWGLPFLEAMAAGKPVIGTRWSAQADFLTVDNSWQLSPRDPIDVGDAACREVPFLDISHRWADPSADELAKILRHAFEHPEEGRAKGRQGRLDATSKWTPAHTARAIVDRLASPPSPTRPVRSASPLDPARQARVSDGLAQVASGIKASTREATAPRAVPIPIGAEDGQFLSIRWEGSQFVHHSLANVNRELCLRLAKLGHDLSLIPFEPDQFGPEGDPDLSLLAQLQNAPLENPCQIHVRHQWPPNLVAPTEGKWVVVQPWEFGSPPKHWIPVFSRRIDELWAYTNHVRDMYLEAGVPAAKVHIVPLGVDCDKFRPGLEPFPLRTKKRFKFLYVGGTIARKGFDVLLNAWKEAFGPHDDVCLVVKDMGGGSFYKGQTAASWIREMQESRQYAEIEYIDTELPPGRIPSLYAACDVLVHPYRGEGFGLPIAEAMACGLPCVVTRGGAADDFCGEAESWGVQAERVPVPGGKVGPFETVAAPWWLEPSAPHLVERLREAFSDTAAREAKGRAARERIANHFTWEHAAAIAQARLAELARQESSAAKPASGKLTISSLDKLAKSITMGPVAPKPADPFKSPSRAPDDELDEMGRMLLLAEAAAARGGLDEADRITEEVVGRFPRQNMAWLARAMVLRGLGKFRKASEAIAKALQERETPEALLESIQIHILAGETGTARKVEKALKDRHAAWLKNAREEFRAAGKPWPPDFLKPAKAAKAPPAGRRVKK